jgi:hypothetical protein
MFRLRSSSEGQRHHLVVLSLGNTERAGQARADTRDTNSLHIRFPACPLPSSYWPSANTRIVRDHAPMVRRTVRGRRDRRRGDHVPAMQNSLVAIAMTTN